MWNKACEELRKHQELLTKVKQNEDFFKDPYGDRLWYLYLLFFYFFGLVVVWCFSAEDIKAEFDNFAESSDADTAESEVETKYSKKKNMKSEGKKDIKRKKKMLLRHGAVNVVHGKLKKASNFQIVYWMSLFSESLTPPLLWTGLMYDKTLHC